MTEIFLMINVLVLVWVIFLLRKWVRQTSLPDWSLFNARLEAFEKAQERLDRAVREEVARNRDEWRKSAQEERQELAEALKAFGDTVGQRMAETTELHKVMLETMSSMIGRLSEANEKKLEEIRGTLEGRLQSIQSDNARQLEQMRQTVDEKLQGALEKRLSESFKQVSDRLEQVHKGLGEMQSLAAGVGDLKKVLTNVKTRGTWGEVQLGAMLEQVLHPDQYAVNVAVKDGGERVEYAVRLPGAGVDGCDAAVWLPIDAKFPLEDYQRLMEAQERADGEGVEAAGKMLEGRVRSCARDICEKYLNPPRTTDFAVLFLPIEGLFAEVIRRSGLTETVQRECRVVIAGPTTLWSILNSLQMGFRTLAIQKRSGEVWNLLSAVKTEWAKYGDMLDMVHKKLNQASDSIDKVRVRSRAIGRKLKEVQELPEEETIPRLNGDTQEEEEEEEKSSSPG